jgi:galactonate dehydratase
MKITKVSPVLVHTGWNKHWCFVKVETDAGLYGWGEAYTQSDREPAIAATVEALGAHLIGRDPTQIRHFVTSAWNDFAWRRGSLELWCAVSGIETALWDILGKAAGLPVYKLLGGACRDRIRVYANGWYKNAKTVDDHIRAAEATVESGFTALKFDPFPGPFRSHVPPGHEDHAVALVEALRGALGPGIEILVEVHRRLAPGPAKRVAQRLEPFRPYWYEEPCPPENVEGLREVRASTRIPIVTGEALYGRMDFRPVLERGAADIINPDVANTGGILELMGIAAMADAYQVAVSPHNFNSTAVGLAATAHASLAMPNFLITEYFTPFEAASAEVAPGWPKPEQGYLT